MGVVGGWVGGWVGRTGDVYEAPGVRLDKGWV